MEDLIFHMFFVVPLTRCITSSERPWNKRNPRSGTILAVLALFLIGVVQSRRDGENYYEVLRVGPNSPPRVISAAYRKLAVQYHPDKNQHPDAKEAFARIREAYGVLTNEKRRNSYLRFGDYSKEGDVDEEQFYDILFLAFFQLLIPFILAYLYTYKNDATPSREIFSCYVATSFALELLLRFDDRSTHYLEFLPFVGDWLPFEKVQLLHSWMPVILNGLLLLGSELANNEDETFDEVTRSAIDWRLDTLVYMERYLCAAETLLKANKAVELRKRWALRVESREDKAAKSAGQLIASKPLKRTANQLSFDDTAGASGGTSTGAAEGKPKQELRVVEGEEEQLALRLYEQFQQEERERLLQHQRDVLQHSQDNADSSTGNSSSGSGNRNSESGSSSSSSHNEGLRRRRNGGGGSHGEEKGSGIGGAAAAGNTDGETAEELSVQRAAGRRMKEKGYVEVLQYVKPWRLDPNNVSDDSPDLWAAAMETEIPSWPENLTMEGIASRADCTERGWDRQQDKIAALMQEADEEDEKLGQGISLGSVIFFGSLLLRWYTGSA